MKKALKVLVPAAAMLCMVMAQGCGSGGGSTVDPPKPPQEQSRAVKVEKAGEDNAAGAKVTYNVAYSDTGDYTYTISNLAAGDKLLFPAGNGVSVDNSSFTDGKVKLIWASSGGAKITVQLLNLSAEQDKVVSVNDINSVFGAGTVTQQ